MTELFRIERQAHAIGSQRVVAGDLAIDLVRTILGVNAEERSMTFAVDYERKLVNGRPAQFHDDRIVVGEGSVRLEINRYSGVVMGFSDDRQFARTVGACKRVADRQF